MPQRDYVVAAVEDLPAGAVVSSEGEKSAGEDGVCVCARAGGESLV